MNGEYVDDNNLDFTRSPQARWASTSSPAGRTPGPWTMPGPGPVDPGPQALEPRNRPNGTARLGFCVFPVDTGQCVCPVGTVCAASDIGYEHMLRKFMEGGPSSLSAVPVAGKRHH